MRRSISLLIPVYVGAALVGVNAAAFTPTPVAAAADVTNVAPPVRARWERGPDRPLRVFVQPAPNAAGWRPALTQAVWAGFARWSTRDIPIRFVRVASASAADVVVEWVDALPGKSIGKTWREDLGGEINAGRITLALHDHRGRALSDDMQRGAVLHEIGHLLGLEHTGRRDSIMYPQVWVTDVSATDLWALRTLYADRAGALGD